MAPYTTTEMRERMVVWRTELGKSTVEIAELAGCSERTVREVLRLHRETGNVHNTFAQSRGGPRSLDQGDMTYISSLLDANPTMYLDELQIKLAETRHVDVSIATLSRALRRLAITHKKVSKAAMERNELLRATWQAEYGDIPAEYFVWLDESSVDNHTNQCMNGWAVSICPCVH